MSGQYHAVGKEVKCLPGMQQVCTAINEKTASSIARKLDSHEALVALLREAYTDYSNPRFTDRHGFADRAKAVLDSIAKP